MGKNSNPKRLKKNERKYLGGNAPKNVDKSDPDYIAKVRAARAEREAKKGLNKVEPRITRKQQRKAKPLIDQVAATKSGIITTPFDDFLNLSQINKQLTQNSFQRISLSKSQSKALADLSDESFAKYIARYKSITGIYMGDSPASGKLFQSLGIETERNIEILTKSRQRIIEARRISLNVQNMKSPSFGKIKIPYGPPKPYTAQDMMVDRNQAFLAEMKRPVRSPIFGPPAPFTQEAADQELAFFRQKVGFEKGSKSVYQARVYRQILDINTEIDFLDRLPKDMQR